MMQLSSTFFAPKHHQKIGIFIFYGSSKSHCATFYWPKFLFLYGDFAVIVVFVLSEFLTPGVHMATGLIVTSHLEHLRVMWKSPNVQRDSSHFFFEIQIIYPTNLPNERCITFWFPSIITTTTKISTKNINKQNQLIQVLTQQMILLLGRHLSNPPFDFGVKRDAETTSPTRVHQQNYQEMRCFSSWWLNQPISKNMLVKLDYFPRDRGESKKKIESTT